MKIEYKDLTNFVYSNLSWGPLFRDKKTDENTPIKNLDTSAEKYITDSLKIMKIKPSELKGKKVFDVGTGRQSRFFAKHGAIVDHIDIAKDSVLALQDWAKKNNKPINSKHGDIADHELEKNKYDIIFLMGIYQHIHTPAYSLVNFINALKPKGIMYMGFYRSGEFKYFVVDSIRYLVKNSMMCTVRDINSILFSFSELNHYQGSRVMDDFFVPKKHNFHPKDVISDVKLLGGKIFHFDDDLREYNHEGSEYFSIGGDRIYITKEKETNVDVNSVKDKLLTKVGKNQLFDIKYKESIILENIELVKKIKILNDTGYISDTLISCLCIGLYQFTRPLVLEESNYYQETQRTGRHKLLNNYLKNFLKNFGIRQGQEFES
tara:strand:+ start:317 stop:1447 length:1131 start_codon:yes stop_codon:yes gene_type:complete